MVVYSERTKERTYTGSNALGAKARVRSWRTSTTQLLITDVRTSCFSRTSMEPAEAASIVDGAFWGLVVQLQPPYAFRAEEYVEPTLRNPIEVATLSLNLPVRVVQVFVFHGRDTPYRKLSPP